MFYQGVMDVSPAQNVKFNIFIDTGDEGVITDPKPAIYGLNRDAVELFYIVVHLGYIKI